MKMGKAKDEPEDLVEPSEDELQAEIEAQRDLLLDLSDPVALAEKVYQIWWRWADLFWLLQGWRF